MEKAIEDEKIRGAYIRQRVESIAREGRERDVERAFGVWSETATMEKVCSAPITCCSPCKRLKRLPPSCSPSHSAARDSV